MEMEREKLNLAVDSILSTWHQGRRVLVVLGAGASVSVGIPNMTAVFGELKNAVEELKGRFDHSVGYPDGRVWRVVHMGAKAGRLKGCRL